MSRRLEVWKDEFVAWVKTLASAAVYATLIVTFGFQVARVEGQSMAPTPADQIGFDRQQARLPPALTPQRGDIIMLYYPLNPDKSVRQSGDCRGGITVRVVDGRVYVNDVPVLDEQVPPEYRSHDDWGPQVIPEGYYSSGRPPEQQLRQPALGIRPEEVHHRQGPAALVAGAERDDLLGRRPTSPRWSAQLPSRGSWASSSP